MPEYKDWNEDLKASLNLPAIPERNIPSISYGIKICLEINELISELKDTDDSL